MELITRHNGKAEEIPSKIFNRLANRLPTRTRNKYLAQIASQEIRRYMTRVSDELIRRHSGPWPGGTTATSLSKRSGSGIRSIRNFSVRIKGEAVEGVWRLRGYMNFHEKGGVIRARRAKYLTIPLPAALDHRGVPRYQSAREWDNTFLGRSRAGNLIIFQKRGNGVVPLYVLKKSVRIPPRLGMRRSLMAERPTLRRDLENQVRALLKGTGR